MAVRAGGGAILTAAGGGMNLGGGVIGAITGLIAMGPAALVAAPAILAFGVVAGGAALIFGGAIAYIGLAGEIIRRERGLPPAHHEADEPVMQDAALDAQQQD